VGGEVSSYSGDFISFAILLEFHDCTMEVELPSDVSVMCRVCVTLCFLLIAK
jgi:hypothetical protein